MQFPKAVTQSRNFFRSPVSWDTFECCSATLVTSWLDAMPTDSRRVRGPEVSQSPSLFVSKPAGQGSSQGPRMDRRQRDQVDLRPVFVRCGLVSQAKGSAYVEAGSTKLMCCVYGPRETERKDETDMKCGRRVSLFIHRNKCAFKPKCGSDAFLSFICIFNRRSTS